jgi:hypothetical protein
MTTSLFWPARTSSFLISSELLAFEENTRTMTLAARIARTIDSVKFSPGLTLRWAIQQGMPRFSSAVQIARAASRSFEDELIKTLALTDPTSISPRSTLAQPRKK